MPKTRRKRRSYTEEQRAEILVAAQKNQLTAADVKKKYGVTPVTYYSWRKKQGIAGRRGRRPGVSYGTIYTGDLNSQVRAEVQAKLRQIVPHIVRSEVSSYLSTLFASGGGRRRRIKT